MSFLPNDYKEPVTNNYMKFQTGDNTFRVLSSAIVGMEFWKTETNEKGEEVRKPIRRRPTETIFTDELGLDSWGNPERPKHFWAFVVYNREAGAIQILEITQKSIRQGLKALVENKKWGDPKEYDIVVTKNGEKLDTEYIVTPEPKEPISEEILKEYEAMNINLEALFSGDDPFATKREEEIDIEDVEINDAPVGAKYAEVIN